MLSFASNRMHFGRSSRGRLNNLPKDFGQTRARAGTTAPCWSPRCPSCWPGPATSCLNPDFTSPFGTGTAQTSASPPQRRRRRSRSPSRTPGFKHPWHFLWVVPTFHAKSHPPSLACRGRIRSPLSAEGRMLRCRVSPRSGNKGQIHAAGAAPGAEHAGALWSSRSRPAAGDNHLVLHGTPLLAGCRPRLLGFIPAERFFAAKKPEKPLGVLQNNPMGSSIREISSPAKCKLTVILPSFPRKCFKYK